MHPELEDFLEKAFNPIRRTSEEIGRVVVEPDYDVTPDEREATALRDQLETLLRTTSPDTATVESFDGSDVGIGAEHELLKKYLRRVTLHADTVSGPWIEVAPPGNWI